VWIFLAVGILIPLIVLANSNRADTKTNQDVVAENIYKEITRTPEPLPPFPIGHPPIPEPVIPVVSDPLAELLRRESGNNRLAVNSSSGACGLGQALPCSKMLNAIGVATLAEASYEAQLAWMMSYITNRYGTVENALAFHNAHNWY
jgi:hypothetical protein